MSGAVRIGLVVSLLATTVTPNDAFAKRKYVTTIGKPTCERWIVARAEEAKGGPSAIIGQLSVTSWVHGFITALNVVVEKDKDILSSIDANTIQEWMDRYCAQNPTNDVVDGSIKLFVSLKKIAN